MATSERHKRLEMFTELSNEMMQAVNRRIANERKKAYEDAAQMVESRIGDTEDLAADLRKRVSDDTA